MTAQPDPYSRFYWRFIEEFPNVYSDDRLFSSWMRLLVAADGAYPSPAALPRRVGSATIKKLVAAGLVTLVGQDHYRVRGVEAERAKRRTEQRNGGVVRAETAARGPDGRFLLDTSGGPAVATSGGIQPVSPAIQLRRDETRRAETRQDEQGAAREGVFEDDEPEFPILQWLAAHGCYLTPGNGYHRQLVTAVERSGANAILSMFDRLSRAGVQDGDTKGFVFGAIDGLKPKPDLRALQDEEDAEVQRKLKAAREVRAAANLAYLRGDFPSFAEALDALREKAKA